MMPLNILAIAANSALTGRVTISTVAVSATSGKQNMATKMSKDFNARGSGHTAAVRMLLTILVVVVVLTVVAALSLA